MLRARSAVLLLAGLCFAQAASAAGIPIRGQVLDPGGAPLAKVRVRLVPVASTYAAGRLALEGKDGPEAVAGTESGADGFFRLEAPEPGMWKVIAGGDKLVPQEALAAPLTCELDLPPVRLRRETGLPARAASPSSVWQNVARPARAKTATGQTLPLRVLGADGKPAAGVLVQAESGTPLGMTGDAGLADLAAPDGALLDLVLLAADGRRLEAQVRPLGAKEPRAPRELRLPALHEAVVRVVSAADDRPLPGALVWTMADTGAFQRADARGEARVPAPVEGVVQIQAAAMGYRSGLQESRSTADRPRKPLRFSLDPDVALTGRVVDESGAPVAGAEITLARAELRDLPMMAWMKTFGARDTLVRSGPDGRFRWSGLAPDDEAELRVAKEGFAPTRVLVAAPVPGSRPAGPLRVVLRRGASAFGRVLGPDQRPIVGARVSLEASVAGDPRQRFQTFLQGESQDAFEAATGADGRFDLGHLPAGRYDLTARGRGWAPLTVPGLVIPDGNRATDLGTLVLARGVVLEGEVVDAAGKPVEGAEVFLNESEGGVALHFREEATEPEALSGADGFFRIEDLRAGSTVDVSAERQGYAPGSAQAIRIPAETPLRLTLQAVGAVSGRVIDPDGRPVAGADVRAEVRPWMRGGVLTSDREPLSGRSDAEGRFRITDVIPGPFSVVAQATGWQEGSVGGLELRGGEEKRGIEVTLSPGAILEGQVLSPAGHALADAEVQLSPEEIQTGFHLTSTDADGRYVLDNLPPGLRTVLASHGEHGSARRQIELRAGENSLDLTLEGGREVSGRVLDEAGSPVAGAAIWLVAGSLPLTARSRGDGSFRFGAVADGSYRAGAGKDGFVPSEAVPVTVEGSSVTGLELRLSRGGSIVGRVTGVEIADLARVQMTARGRGMPAGGSIDVDGSYRIDNLKEGEWRVRAELPGTSLYAEGSVRLEPGVSETRLDLEMESGFELTGRVRRNGAPVAGEILRLEGPRQEFVTTDADGRFRVQGLPAGTYRLRLGFLSRVSGREETIELQGDREITLDLPTADVTGRVVDAADASPIHGAAVQLLSAAGEPGGEAQTDSRGVFVVRGVADGPWRLRAQADGYAPGEASVQVDGGGTPDGAEISLRATEGVTLQVAAAAGPPLQFLFYVVLDGAGRQVGDGTASVADGRARLARVPPGAWQVLLFSGSNAPLEIAVTAPGNAGPATLPPSCILRVRVPALEAAQTPATVRLLGPGGRPFRTFGRIREAIEVFDLSRGTHFFDNVPPGTWDVQVTAADGRTWRTTATTAPGVPAEAVVE